MAGSLAIAIWVIDHHLPVLLHHVFAILPLRRSHTLFLLLSLAVLALQMPLAVLRTVQAASPQRLAACQELLVNGDLETSGGWRFGATPASGTVVDAPVHAGAFAIRLGISTGANTLAYSTAYQMVTLPATAEQILLTYWERPGVTGDSGDYREVIALRTDFTVLRSLSRQTGAGNDQWAQRTFDLTDLAGQSIVLYFNVYNNGSGATLVNYLDDLALQSCDDTTLATPTATPLATSTPTPTTVATPPTPTPTPTATRLSSGVIVRAGSVAVADGQTTVAVPLDLIGATAERPVGVLSVDVQYNAAVLKATACTIGGSFDLLLCNTDSPGVIQLAGVAATGIQTDVRIADLGFELLPPANLSTQLTVQLDTVADVEGTALSATGQPGQISIACAPSSDACQTLFLPLVHR